MKSINEKMLAITALALEINQNYELNVSVDLDRYQFYVRAYTFDSDKNFQFIGKASAWITNQKSDEQVGKTHAELDNITYLLEKLKQQQAPVLAVAS